MNHDIKNEIINKVGFPLYVDYWDKYFSIMTGDQIKETLQIIFNFNKTFDVMISKEPVVNIVVNTIVDNIKRDAVKRMKQSKASKENGKLGGRPKLTQTNNDKPKVAKRFIKPTIQEIQNYCQERNNKVNPENFFDYYEARGWKEIKDWKACVRTWERNNFDNKNQQTTKTNYLAYDPNADYSKDGGFYD